MTTILGRYIIRVTVSSILLACLLVMSVDLIFAFVRELKRTGVGDYNALIAVQVVLLSLPHRLYNIFPMSSLLGTMMGLGALASQSELIVMRASGVSIKQIATAVMTAAFGMSLIVAAMGEWVVPQGERLGGVIKATAQSRGTALLTDKGTWIRDDNDFIYIEKILKGGILVNVTRYRFNDDRQLELATHAREAQIKDHHWIFSDVIQSEIAPDKIIQKNYPTLTWPSVVDPEVLQVLVADPDELSIAGLYRYMDYLKDNSLDTKHYALEFWKKIFEPLSIMVMVFTAIPFIFGPLRNATMGLRMLAGISVGFLFFMMNKIFGPIALVYNWPPILGALLPSVVFGLMSGVLLKRVK